MPVVAGNELYIRVRLDGTAAIGEFKKMEGEASMGFRRVSRIAASALAFFYGGIARQAGAQFAQLGDLVGRGGSGMGRRPMFPATSDGDAATDRDAPTASRAAGVGWRYRSERGGGGCDQKCDRNSPLEKVSDPFCPKSA